jgi:hypothetical protein
MSNLAGASRLSRYPPARRAPPQACRRACPGRTTQGCTCGHANSLSAVRVGAGGEVTSYLGREVASHIDNQIISSRSHQNRRVVFDRAILGQKHRSRSPCRFRISDTPAAARRRGTRSRDHLQLCHARVAHRRVPAVPSHCLPHVQGRGLGAAVHSLHPRQVSLQRPARNALSLSLSLSLSVLLLGWHPTTPLLSLFSLR